MYKKKIKISYSPGLHARPATIIAQKASGYDAKIILKNEAGQADLKSLLGVLSLGVACGEEIIIKAEGKDEKKAVEEIARFISSDLEKEIEEKFSTKDDSKQEIIEKIKNDTAVTKSKYNVESEKLLNQIGIEVKNKIDYIKELVNVE